MNLPSLPERLRGPAARLRPRWPRRRGTAVALGAGALIGVLAVTGVLPALARVAPPLPDVLIRKLALQLAFGPPPQQSPPAPAPVLAIPPVVGGPASRPLDPDPIALPFEPFQPVEMPCDLDTSRPVFPKEPLSTSLKGVLLEGTYLWRHEGTFTIGASDAAITVPLTGFTERVIADLDVADDGSFTYTYRSRFTFFQQEERIRIAPGDGIYLERLERRNGDGPFLQFEPLTPIKIVSLPIPLEGIQAPALVEGQVQEQLDDPDADDDPWDRFDDARRTETSGGFDPTRRMAMTISAAVAGHERINACGHLTDAYIVRGTRTLMRDAFGAGAATDTGQSVERFEFAIAPQLGGLLVRERFVTETPGFIGPLPYMLDATFTAGSLEPDGGLDGVEDEPAADRGAAR